MTLNLAASGDYKVYALDAVTGAKKWEFATGRHVQSSPAVSMDGTTIYVGSWDRKVYALDSGLWEEARKTMILFYLANTNSPILILTDDAIKCIFQELCK